MTVYVTLEQAMQAIGVPSSSTAADDKILLAMEAASRDVDAHCERHFGLAETATARVFTADDPGWVTVDDIATDDDLVIATDDDLDGVYETTWAPGDVQADPLNGVVAGQTGWPIEGFFALGRRFPVHGRRALVQVTATWGWSAVPSAVVSATLAQLSTIYKSPEAVFGVAAIGEYGPISVRPLHPTARHLLTRFVRDPVKVA